MKKALEAVFFRQNVIKHALSAVPNEPADSPNDSAAPPNEPADAPNELTETPNAPADRPETPED